jgi:uncharacterized protein
MKILFHLGHPAHFHLLKNTIKSLQELGVESLVLIKKKDVLEELLKSTNIPYLNILPSGRKDSLWRIALGLFIQDVRMMKLCTRGKRPDILIGTSASISHIGRIIGRPSLILNEDDASVVPFFSNLAYPWATNIISPRVCKNDRWESKSIKYDGYHELAYLHVNNFYPSRSIASKYVNIKQPYFLIRFAKLGAHHDKGISGIDNDIAMKLIEELKPHGQVFITSERKLSSALDRYRIGIKPIDLHHVLAFAEMFVGDSQTMAAESGVLGVPFIRFNDFVGEISYLDEMENKYKLGFGIKTKDGGKLFGTVNNLVNMHNRKVIFQKRRRRMLSEKIDFAPFLTWVIMNYPTSLNLIRNNSGYQKNFHK